MTIRSEVRGGTKNLIAALCYTCPTEGKYKNQGVHLGIEQGGNEGKEALIDASRTLIWHLAEEHDEDFPKHDIKVLENWA